MLDVLCQQRDNERSYAGPRKRSQKKESNPLLGDVIEIQRQLPIGF